MITGNRRTPDHNSAHIGAWIKILERGIRSNRTLKKGGIQCEFCEETFTDDSNGLAEKTFHTIIHHTAEEINA